ncbi:hypothetical protein MexAM1_p2METAp0036 (plasmid) [Methylorubrum extorquens AM1]|uniref:Uncharacterized protein n=1 Tax=Methylorubrum extorquens (strain ATCC 14718 / DSM 1338 / JCM 2805 / NCIMB 9133 / AM1) TaxID=272630 RepID=C5B6T9_METEA|nr:hypothetical protein MexAM1_p2METAp0036 [Methylorubrum extorquens AM1]
MTANDRHPHRSAPGFTVTVQRCSRPEVRAAS